MVSFMTVEGGYPLGYFRRQVSLASLLTVLPLSQRSFGRMGAWVLKSCMVQSTVTLRKVVTSPNPWDLGLEQARDCTEQIDTHASASERGPPVAE